MPWARVYFVEAPVPVPEVAALTNAAGTVTLEAPARGRYRLGVAAEGLAGEIVTMEVGDAGACSASVTLRSTGEESAR